MILNKNKWKIGLCVNYLAVQEESKAWRTRSCPHCLAAQQGTLNFACSLWFAAVYASVYQKQKGNRRVRVKSPPKAMSLYVGPSNTVLPVVPKSLLNWPCVFGLVCFFPNCLKILFFKKRIKKQKLHALEIKVQCIQWLYSCLLISCVGTPIFKTFCIKFVKPL